MKITIAIEKFDPNTGGAERYCWDFAHYLVKRGHVIIVLCMQSIPPANQSIRVEKLGVLRFPQAFRHLSFAIQHYLKTKNMKDCIHFCVGNTFYMDFYQPHGGIHKAWFDRETQRYPERVRPIMSFFNRLNLKDLVQRSLEWWTFTRTRPQVIAISQMVSDDLRKYFQYPEQLIKLIPNGIDTEKFSPNNLRYRDEIRRRYGIDKTEFVFLFVAQNLSLKGFDTLVEACRRLKENPFRVLVIGPAGRMHRNKARELEERVIFGGRALDLEKIYPACDCLVHPSFYDACSLVVLEALASGIPVITTSSNGASMFIQPEYGVVVEPGDVGTLADAMKSMVERSGRTHGVLPFDSNHEVFAKLERILKADAV